MIDLFGESGVVPKKFSPTFDTEKDVVVAVRIVDQEIFLASDHKISEHKDYKNLFNPFEDTREDSYVYVIPLRPTNAFILRHLLKSWTIEITPGDAKILTREADVVPMPYAKMAETGKHIELKTPFIGVYNELLSTLNAYPVKSGFHRISINRFFDLEALNKTLATSLPKIAFSEKVKALQSDPIPGFDGTLQSLKNVSVGVLKVVNANAQTNKNLRKSSKSMLEKMEDFGIVSIFDLIHWLPKRYIDKREPQEIVDLFVDEPATIVGEIISIGDLPQGKGVRFDIQTSSTDSISVSFWGQNWLRNKFRIGDKVFVTGKVKMYRKKKQINGSSIEYSREAAALPIVPIYKQSESKGITTAFLLSAIRETFSRLGSIQLPKYLLKDDEDRVDYGTAFAGLHLPEDLETNKRILNALAYYELVYMQILIQLEKTSMEGKPGVVMKKTRKNFQDKMIKGLPFQLTNSQNKAIAQLNDKLSDKSPSITLVNAEVGSGKTIIAQAACLRAVESGFQSALIGPTEVLAQQLYNTFSVLVDRLNNAGENIKLVYYASGMKVREKNAILEMIHSGEADIIVGTHALLTDQVKYSNLGFVAIDEQQKFGAEQRSKLLESRPDGKVPDLLMQTATPIPRSTAQVFYGDIDMILLDEKPPGRIPIVTEWVQEDPQMLLEQLVNPIWDDVFLEAEKGNQTFVITPMVQDSDRVDASSVESTFKKLSASFPTLKIGYVHGKMKKDEQRETMTLFRDKKYDVLVASTVVEVGVDIPDATRVIVLSAERLGASSLHQIRGRVGRNSKPSKCYLVSSGRTENSQMRLQSLVDHDNGFDVAKTDLAIRGEGTFFGSSQSGASDMVFANILRHGKWIYRAREEAKEILSGEYRDQAICDAREKFDTQHRLV